MMERLYAVCAPGLEPFTLLELEQLGLIPDPSSSGYGGIEFQGSLQDVYRTNLHLRTASRVLVRLGEFYASAFPELRRKASRLSWEKYLTPEGQIALRVTCEKSRLYHEGAVAERLEGAIADRLGRSPSVQRFNEESRSDPPQLIVVRIVDNLCTISIDSSGALLHRRGYRLATAKAPLRETIAAAMVMASEWDGTSALLDPCCGSGTIPIEAALWARRIPPGYRRSFAFMDWPDFDSRFWDKSLTDAVNATVSASPRIIASDRDAGAVKAARSNAERAGVEDCIEFSVRPVSAIDPPPFPGWIITNPPYGVRLSKTKDLRNLYAQLGKVFRAKCPGWHVTMISDTIRLIRITGLKFDKAISLMNGGLRVKLVTGHV